MYTCTLEHLNQICEKNNIPKNVELMSDSGWECDATSIGGAYYHPRQNILVFVQGIDDFEEMEANWGDIWKETGRYPQYHPRYGWIALTLDED